MFNNQVQQATEAGSDLLRSLKEGVSQLNLLWLNAIVECSKLDYCEAPRLFGVSKEFVNLVRENIDQLPRLAESRLLYWTIALNEQRFVQLLRAGHSSDVHSLMDSDHVSGPAFRSLTNTWVLSAKMDANYDIAQAAHIYGISHEMSRVLKDTTPGSITHLAKSPEVTYRLMTSEKHLIERLTQPDTRTTTVVVASRLGKSCRPPKMVTQIGQR